MSHLRAVPDDSVTAQHDSAATASARLRAMSALEVVQISAVNINRVPTHLLVKSFKTTGYKYH